VLRLDEIDLNLLHTFRVFVERGSVQAAARALGRSQPAISSRLHQLQRDLGVDLLERRGRRLVLTAVGRAFDARARVVVEQLQALVDQAHAAGERPSGVLRIAALPTVGVFVLAPRLARFTARHPDVEVELDYRHLQPSPALRSGGLDVLLGVGEPPGGELDVTVLGTARPVVVTPRNDTPRKGRVGQRELLAMRWVGYGMIEDPFFGTVWRFLEDSGLTGAVRTRVRHIETLKMLVRQGAGATILPDYTVVEPELVGRRMQGLDFSMPIWAGVRLSSLRVPAVAAFMRALVRTPDGP
jgi:DNA-binding transcriptional LysR family regulator